MPTRGARLTRNGSGKTCIGDEGAFRGVNDKLAPTSHGTQHRTRHGTRHDQARTLWTLATATDPPYNTTAPAACRLSGAE